MQEKASVRAAAHQLLHRLRGHGSAPQHLSLGRAVLAAEGHIAVEVKDLSHRIQHGEVPPSGQEQLDPPLPQGLEGLADGWGDLMGLEADQHCRLHRKRSPLSWVKFLSL